MKMIDLKKSVAAKNIQSNKCVHPDQKDKGRRGSKRNICKSDEVLKNQRILAQRSKSEDQEGVTVISPKKEACKLDVVLRSQRILTGRSKSVEQCQRIITRSRSEDCIANNSHMPKVKNFKSRKKLRYSTESIHTLCKNPNSTNNLAPLILNSKSHIIKRKTNKKGAKMNQSFTLRSKECKLLSSSISSKFEENTLKHSMKLKQSNSSPKKISKSIKTNRIDIINRSLKDSLKEITPQPPISKNKFTLETQNSSSGENNHNSESEELVISERLTELDHQTSSSISTVFNNNAACSIPLNKSKRSRTRFKSSKKFVESNANFKKKSAIETRNSSFGKKKNTKSEGLIISERLTELEHQTSSSISTAFNNNTVISTTLAKSRHSGMPLKSSKKSAESIANSKIKSSLETQNSSSGEKKHKLEMESITESATKLDHKTSSSSISCALNKEIDCSTILDKPKHSRKQLKTPKLVESNENADSDISIIVMNSLNISPPRLVTKKCSDLKSPNLCPVKRIHVSSNESNIFEEIPRSLNQTSVDCSTTLLEISKADSVDIQNLKKLTYQRRSKRVQERSKNQNSAVGHMNSNGSLKSLPVCIFQQPSQMNIAGELCDLQESSQRNTADETCLKEPQRNADNKTDFLKESSQGNTDGETCLLKELQRNTDGETHCHSTNDVPLLTSSPKRVTKHYGTVGVTEDCVLNEKTYLKSRTSKGLQNAGLLDSFQLSDHDIQSNMITSSCEELQSLTDQENEKRHLEPTRKDNFVVQDKQMPIIETIDKVEKAKQDIISNICCAIEFAPFSNTGPCLKSVLKGEVCEIVDFIASMNRLTTKNDFNIVHTELNQSSHRIFLENVSKSVKENLNCSIKLSVPLESTSEETFDSTYVRNKISADTLSFSSLTTDAQRSVSSDVLEEVKFAVTNQEKKDETKNVKRKRKNTWAHKRKRKCTRNIQETDEAKEAETSDQKYVDAATNEDTSTELCNFDLPETNNPKVITIYREALNPHSSLKGTTRLEDTVLNIINDKRPNVDEVVATNNEPLAELSSIVLPETSNTEAITVLQNVFNTRSGIKVGTVSSNLNNKLLSFNGTNATNNGTQIFNSNLSKTSDLEIDQQTGREVPNANEDNVIANGKTSTELSNFDLPETNNSIPTMGNDQVFSHESCIEGIPSVLLKENIPNADGNLLNILELKNNHISNVQKPLKSFLDAEVVDSRKADNLECKKTISDCLLSNFNLTCLPETQVESSLNTSGNVEFMNNIIDSVENPNLVLQNIKYKYKQPAVVVAKLSDSSLKKYMKHHDNGSDFQYPDDIFNGSSDGVVTKNEPKTELPNFVLPETSNTEAITVVQNAFNTCGSNQVIDNESWNSSDNSDATSYVKGPLIINSKPSKLLDKIQQNVFRLLNQKSDDSTSENLISNNEPPSETLIAIPEIGKNVDEIQYTDEIACVKLLKQKNEMSTREEVSQKSPEHLKQTHNKKKNKLEFDNEIMNRKDVLDKNISLQNYRIPKVKGQSVKNILKSLKNKEVKKSSNFLKNDCISKCSKRQIVSEVKTVEITSKRKTIEANSEEVKDTNTNISEFNPAETSSKVVEISAEVVVSSADVNITCSDVIKTSSEVDGTGVVSEIDTTETLAVIDETKSGSWVCSNSVCNKIPCSMENTENFPGQLIKCTDQNILEQKVSESCKNKSSIDINSDSGLFKELPEIDILSELLGGESEILDYDAYESDCDMLNSPKSPSVVSDEDNSSTSGYWKKISPRKIDNRDHTLVSEALPVYASSSPSFFSANIKSTAGTSQVIKEMSEPCSTRNTHDVIMESESEEEEDHSFKRFSHVETNSKPNFGQGASSNHIENDTHANSRDSGISSRENSGSRDIPRSSNEEDLIANNNQCKSFIRNGQCLKKNCYFLHTLPTDKNSKKSDSMSKVTFGLLSTVRNYCNEGTLNRAFQVVEENITCQPLEIKNKIILLLTTSSVRFTNETNQDFLSKILSLITLHHLYNDPIICSQVIITCNSKPKQTLFFIVEMFKICISYKVHLSHVAITMLFDIFSKEGVDLLLSIELLEYVNLNCKQSISYTFLNLVIDNCTCYGKHQYVKRMSQLLCNVDLKFVDQNVLNVFIGKLAIKNCTAKAMYTLKTYKNQFLNPFHHTVARTEINIVDEIHNLIVNNCYNKLAALFRDHEALGDKFVIHSIHNALRLQLAKSGQCYRKFVAAITAPGIDLYPRETHWIGLIGICLMLEAHYRKEMNTAYMILYTLHENDINYHELLMSSTDVSDSIKHITINHVFPCTVLLIAIDICLEVRRFDSAFGIFSDLNWIKPCDNYDQELKRHMFLSRAKYLLKLSSALYSLNSFDKGLKVLEVLLDSVQADLTLEDTAELIADLIAIYNCYLVFLLNKGKLDDAMNLYKWSKTQNLEGYLEVKSYVLRGIVVSHANAGLTEEAKEFFLQFVIKKIYLVPLPDFSNCLELDMDWTPYEIHLVIDYYLENLFEEKLKIQPLGNFEHEFSLTISFVKREIKNLDPTANSRSLRCLRKETSFRSNKEALLNVLSSKMEPPLLVESNISSDKTITIKPKSIFEKYCFWKLGKVNDKRATPFKSLAVNNAFCVSPNDSFSFGCRSTTKPSCKTPARSERHFTLESMENNFTCIKVQPENTDYLPYSSQSSAAGSSDLSPSLNNDWLKFNKKNSPSGVCASPLKGSSMSDNSDTLCTEEEQFESNPGTPVTFSNTSSIAVPIYSPTAVSSYKSNNLSCYTPMTVSKSKPVPVPIYTPTAISKLPALPQSALSNSKQSVASLSLPSISKQTLMMCQTVSKELNSVIRDNLDANAKSGEKGFMQFSESKKHAMTIASNSKGSLSKGSTQKDISQKLKNFDESESSSVSAVSPKQKLSSRFESFAKKISFDSVESSQSCVLSGISPLTIGQKRIPFSQTKKHLKTIASNVKQNVPKSCSKNVTSRMFDNSAVNSPQSTSIDSLKLELSRSFSPLKRITGSPGAVVESPQASQSSELSVISPLTVGKHLINSQPKQYTKAIPKQDIPKLCTEIDTSRMCQDSTDSDSPSAFIASPKQDSKSTFRHFTLWKGNVDESPPQTQSSVLSGISPLKLGKLQKSRVKPNSDGDILCHNQMSENKPNSPKLRRSVGLQSLTLDQIQKFDAKFNYNDDTSCGSEATQPKENQKIQRMTLNSSAKLKRSSLLQSQEKQTLNLQLASGNHNTNQLQKHSLQNNVTHLVVPGSSKNKLAVVSNETFQLPSQDDSRKIRRLKREIFKPTTPQVTPKRILVTPQPTPQKLRTPQQTPKKKAIKILQMAAMKASSKATDFASANMFSTVTKAANFKCTEEVFVKIKHFIKIKILNKQRHNDDVELEAKAINIATTFISRNDVSKLDSKTMKLLMNFVDKYV